MPLKEKEKIIVARLLYLACLVVLEYNNKDKIRYVKRREKESERKSDLVQPNGTKVHGIKSLMTMGGFGPMFSTK
jgi:hypothetical protein